MMPNLIRNIFCALLVSACSLSASAQDGEKWLEAKTLSPKSLAHRGLSVPDPFDGWKVLRTLFPGNYYHKDEKQMINWKCPACASQNYWDANSQYYPTRESDSEAYPASDGLSTRLLKVYSVKDATGEYRYLAFYHSAYDVDGLQMGRFNGGLLGIAQFRRNGAAWVLQKISPAIAAYGAFDYCPVPELLAIGDGQYGFLLTHANGGAGGPYNGDMALIAYAGGRYRQVMFAGCISQFNTMPENEWKSRLTVLPGKNRFRDLNITTSGEYAKDPEWPLAPCGLAARFAGRQRCGFAIITRYTYAAGKGYQQTGKPVVLLKAK